MKKVLEKRLFWLIILLFGITPYFITLFISVYKMITGFGGLCITECQKEYGISVFMDIWIIYVYLFYYIYIIGIILIIVSLIKLKKINKSKN